MKFTSTQWETGAVLHHDTDVELNDDAIAEMGHLIRQRRRELRWVQGARHDWSEQWGAAMLTLFSGELPLLTAAVYRSRAAADRCAVLLEKCTADAGVPQAVRELVTPEYYQFVQPTANVAGLAEHDAEKILALVRAFAAVWLHSTRMGAASDCKRLRGDTLTADAAPESLVRQWKMMEILRGMLILIKRIPPAAWSLLHPQSTCRVSLIGPMSNNCRETTHAP